MSLLSKDMKKFENGLIFFYYLLTNKNKQT